MEKNLIPGWLKDGYVAALSPVVRAASRGAIDPNLLTLISLLVSVASGVVMAAGALRLGGALILVSGTFDILDGAVARAANRTTKFGALWDSSLDRYAEFAVMWGILMFYLNQGYFFSGWVVMALGLALCGSFMVSYVRARAEGLGFECKVGWLQRPERIVLLGFGALIHETVLAFFVLLIAVFSNLTAIQRLQHIWKASRSS